MSNAARWFCAASVLALLLCTESPAGAAGPIPALAGFQTRTYDGPYEAFIEAIRSTDGWSFRTTAPLTVTALGVYDYLGENGLLEHHEVAIWDQEGHQLAWANVPYGRFNGTQLIGDYRYVSIAPIELPANQVFVVGAVTVNGKQGIWPSSPTDSFPWGIIQPGSGQLNPGLSLVADCLVSPWNSDAQIMFPSETAQNRFSLAGNFLYTAAVVPEPACGTGFVLLALALLKRRCGAA